MKKKYIDCISGAVLILFGLWGWYETSSWKGSAASSGISPKVYPRAVFTLLMVCGAIILGRTIVKMLLSKMHPAEDLDRMVDIHIVKVIAILIMMVLYIFALQAVGFLISTPVFLFLSMLLFGERKWLRMILISVVGSVVLYLFFVQLMNVRF